MQENKVKSQIDPQDHINRYKNIPSDVVKILGLDVDNMSILAYITGNGGISEFNEKKQYFIDIHKKENKLMTNIWKENNKELKNDNHPLINLIVDSFLSQRKNGIQNLQIYINSIAFSFDSNEKIKAIMNPIINAARKKFQEITKEKNLPNCDLIVPSQDFQNQKDTSSEQRILSYKGDKVESTNHKFDINGMKYGRKNNIGDDVIKYISQKVVDFKDKKIINTLVDNDPKYCNEFVQSNNQSFILDKDEEVVNFDDENFFTFNDQDNENKMKFSDEKYSIPMTRLLHTDIKVENDRYYQKFGDVTLKVQDFDPNTVLFDKNGKLTKYSEMLNDALGVGPGKNNDVKNVKSNVVQNFKERLGKNIIGKKILNKKDIFNKEESGKYGVKNFNHGPLIIKHGQKNDQFGQDKIHNKSKIFDAMYNKPKTLEKDDKSIPDFYKRITPQQGAQIRQYIENIQNRPNNPYITNPEDRIINKVINLYKKPTMDSLDKKAKMEEENKVMASDMGLTDEFLKIPGIQRSIKNGHIKKQIQKQQPLNPMAREVIKTKLPVVAWNSDTRLHVNGVKFGQKNNNDKGRG